MRSYHWANMEQGKNGLVNSETSKLIDILNRCLRVNCKQMLLCPRINFLPNGSFTRESDFAADSGLC